MTILIKEIIKKIKNKLTINPEKKKEIKKFITIWIKTSIKMFIGGTLIVAIINLFRIIIYTFPTLGIMVIMFLLISFCMAAMKYTIES